MCGRFALDEHADDAILDFLSATGDAANAWSPHHSWNIAPTQTIAVLAERYRDGRRTRHAASARWSLVPRSSPSLTVPYPTFNARSEAIAAKPSWRVPVAETRCLIPASGYYEWRTQSRNKTPFFIYANERPLMFAGLYSWWRASEEDEWLLTATIVTREATGPLAELHERAPLALPQELQDRWVDPTVRADQRFVDEISAASIPEIAALRFHEVAPLRGDGPELIRPLAG